MAEAEIVDVLKMSPEDLWNVTKNASGISKQFFDTYFKNCNVAYAYRLGSIKVYEEPKELTEYGVRAAPQSFVYVG